MAVGWPAAAALPAPAGAGSHSPRAPGRGEPWPLTQPISYGAEVWARSARLPLVAAGVHPPTLAGSLCPTGGRGYGPESGEEDFAAFRAWLRCYGVPGMSSLRDRRGRTIWFQGDPGPLAPKGGKSRKKKPKGAQQGPEHRTEGPLLPSAARSRSRGARRGPPEQGTAQQPEGTSLQQDPEVPLAPVKGRRRRQPAASGHRRPQRIKANTRSLEEGMSAS